MSEARKTASAAISSGSISFGFSSLPSLPNASRKPSVSTPPGQMQLTSMPCCLTSAATLSVRLINAAFVTRYAVRPLPPLRPPMLEILMILPYRFSIMLGRANFVSNAAAVRFTSMTRRHRSASKSTRSIGGWMMAALLTNISTPPNFVVVSSAMRWMSRSTLRSAVTANPAAPASST